MKCEKSDLQEPTSTDPQITGYSTERILKSVIIFAVVGALLYGAAGIVTDYRTILGAIVAFPFDQLIIVLSAVVIGWLIRAWRFDFYLKRSGLKAGFLYSTATFLAGFALTGTPGKVGEAVKGVFLKRDYGFSYTKLVGIVMIERLMDLWGVLILGSFSILLFEGWENLFLFCGVAVICGGLFLSIENLYKPILEKLGQIRIFTWISVKVLHILLAAKELMTPGTFFLGLLLSTLSWGLESFAMYVILRGLDLTVGMLEANFVYSFSTLIGALSMLPGGVGGTEAAMIGLLKVLGVSYSSALPAVILIRVCTLWFAVFVGTLVIFFMMSTKASRISGKKSTMTKVT